MKFNDMPYARPDIDALLAQLADYVKQAEAAQSEATLLELFWAQDKTLAHYATAANLANIHYTLDTRDAYWTAERDFYDENTPAVGNGQIKLSAAFLANPHVGILEKTFGETILPTLKNDVLSADERVLDLQKEENALASAYQKVYGGAMVDFDGKSMTLPQLAAYKESADASVRLAAYAAEGGYFDAHRAEFDDIYSKMIVCRNKQAQILGYTDYSELAYIRMNRIGYGQKEVENYRKQIAEEVVPLVHKLRDLRMKRVGIAAPHYADNLIAFVDGNPAPQGTEAQLMAACAKMYHELSPETAEFIDYMQVSDLFDVQSYEGKMSGGYQETIPDHAAPFIFANWNGTFGDVDVLTHEAGHAFEAYLAARNPAIPNCLSAPGLESCEIHSMSMEFLTSPWHHLFFGADTEKYQLAHAEDALFFLPYGCMVDEFQHVMYQQPDLTPEQRNDVWMLLEAKYRPWNRFDDLPFYGRGAGWQRQLHIYQCPFYYIDYCLAQTVALQFFAAHLANEQDAWVRFLALTRRAGLDSYEGLVRAAGLEVPFADGSIKAVADAIGDWILAHQL
ncbi:MAG: M3 family oligoendopeptidase [Faecalibacterium sp.]